MLDAVRAARSRSPLDIGLEWGCFALSAFGAYVLSFSPTSSWTWTAWAAWLIANLLGAVFTARRRCYGLTLQMLVFIPSSLHGLADALMRS